MRVAAIDIGTNTVLLLVAEMRAGVLVAIEEHATITRLGQGVDRSRSLAPEAISRTCECLSRYAEITRRLGTSRVAVVGTSAMRDAGGGEQVKAHVAEVFGVEARVISGDEEAKLTFRGALSGLSLPDDPIAVFDIGGGSTEFVVGKAKEGNVSFAHSFDIGSVRMTERYVRSDPPTEGELSAVRRAVEEALAPLTVEAKAPVGIAGTVTTLAAIAAGLEPYDGSRVHGQRLTRAQIAGVIERLAAMPLEARRAVRGLEPKRADVVVAGALIALVALEKLGADAMIVSDRGVRWGLAEELLAALPDPA